MQPRLHVLPRAVPVQPVRRLGAAHVAAWQPQQRQVLASRSPPGHRAIPESRHPEVLPRSRGAEGSGSSAEDGGSLVEVYGGLAGLHGAAGYLPGSSGGLYGSAGELSGSKRGPAPSSWLVTPPRNAPREVPVPFFCPLFQPPTSATGGVAKGWVYHAPNTAKQRPNARPNSSRVTPRSAKLAIGSGIGECRVDDPTYSAHGSSPHRETPPARCPSPFSTSGIGECRVDDPTYSASRPPIGQQGTRVDGQPEQVNRVLFVQSGVEIVFLFGLGQLLEKIALALGGFIPRLALPSPYFA